MNLKTIKAYSLATLLFLPLCAFAQTPQDDKNDNRVELTYKQRHSKPANDLYADGIKIKRDLSLIKEAQEERIMDMDEIPQDELYGGVWNNRYVNVYGSVESVPETFKVDLSNFSMPTMGYTTSNYGRRGRRTHHGIDLKVQVGDTIYAMLYPMNKWRLFNTTEEDEIKQYELESNAKEGIDFEDITEKAINILVKH